MNTDDELLVIDTGLSGNQPQEILPLPVYDDNHPMLLVDIPEYTLPLPNPTMNRLVQRLKMTMKMYSGIGLAANQCGVLERVFIIGTDQFQIACINPKVIKISEEMVNDREGCLTFPALFLTIHRPSWIEVEFTTETGEVKQMRLDGLTARCFLHELDHLNGVKFTSHVGKVSLQMAQQRAKKMIKKMIRIKKNANGLQF